MGFVFQSLWALAMVSEKNQGSYNLSRHFSGDALSSKRLFVHRNKCFAHTPASDILDVTKLTKVKSTMFGP